MAIEIHGGLTPGDVDRATSSSEHGFGPLAITSSALASLGTPTSGVIRRLSDDLRDFQFGDGVSWLSLTGETVNVKWFGAKGDGATNDSVAIRNAIQAAIARSLHPIVYFPPGTYMIHDDGVFSDIGQTLQSGLNVCGAGMNSSKLKLVTGGSVKWFYNNGATSRMSRPCFMDLGFETDAASTGMGNGFHLTSTGHEQHFTFVRCRLIQMHTLLKMSGAVGNDSHRFVNCDMREIYGPVCHWNNVNAVVIEFFACNGELLYGDPFYVESGGGGDLRVYGGSWIMDSVVGDTTQHYLVKADSSNNVGTSMTFFGIKPEMRSAYTSLVKALGDLGGLRVTFHATNFDALSGGIREVVWIGLLRRVQFIDCYRMNSSFTYRIDATVGTSGSSGTAGIIEWVRCGIPEDLSEKVTLVTEYGRASARDCHIQSSGIATRQAVDFDLNWQNQSVGDIGMNLKRAVVMRGTNVAWPFNSGSERTLKLPKNAIIKNIYARKPAQGVSVSAYQLHVGTNDKATTYGSSVSGNQSLLHTITLKDVDIDVASDANKRTIRLWATGGDTAHSGGWAYVEYL